MAFGVGFFFPSSKKKIYRGSQLVVALLSLKLRNIYHAPLYGRHYIVWGQADLSLVYLSIKHVAYIYGHSGRL